MQRNVFVSLILLVLSISGCGGGGGGSTSTVVVSGIASKGPFISGTVNVYDVSGGIEAKRLIDSGAINSDGQYGITIPASSTPIMIEVAAGSVYIDEAKVALTRELRRTTLVTPLRAILPSVSSNASVSVTPFTELAVRKAALAGSLSATVINDANALIAEVYDLPNILTTTPVDASAEITSNDTAAIDYGLALAAVSQLAQGNDVATALETLEINGNLLTSNNADSFTTALSTFLASTNNVNLVRFPNLAATSFSDLATEIPTTAVIEVGLRESYSNVYSLNFRMAVSPVEGVSGNPAVIPINEAVGVAGTSGIGPLIGVLDGRVATVFMVKNSTSSPGSQIVANSPVVRMTYALANGIVPEFSLNLDVQNTIAIDPLLLTDPQNSALGVVQALTPDDYYVTVTYQ